MEAQIRILVELSRADHDCHLLRDRYETIPREIDRHQSELRVQRQMLEDAERRLEDARRERRALERESDLARARRRELELQQHRVKNNNEYQALTREIEDQRRRSSDSEDRGLVLLSEEEASTVDVARLTEVVAQEEARFNEVRDRLDGERRDLGSQLTRAEEERRALVGTLEPSIRKRYERIFENKGTAVVGVEGGACDGCYYQLPPQRLHEVKKSSALILCEGCGRILVWAGG